MNVDDAKMFGMSLEGILAKHNVSIPAVDRNALQSILEEAKKADNSGRRLFYEGDYKSAFCQRILAGILYERAGNLELAGYLFDKAGKMTDRLFWDVEGILSYRRAAANYPRSNLPEEKKNVFTAYSMLKAAGSGCFRIINLLGAFSDEFKSQEGSTEIMQCYENSVNLVRRVECILQTLAPPPKNYELWKLHKKIKNRLADTEIKHRWIKGANEE